MKIGIFGGSFNPVHNVHEMIGTALVEKGYLDKVIYVPVGDKYKKNSLVSANHRYNMLTLMAKDKPFLEVSAFENNSNLIYTYETLNYFKNIYPNEEIYFICGSDNLKDIVNWKNYWKILTNYKILAIKRDKDSIDDILTSINNNKNIIPVTLSFDNISSTLIRDLLKRDDDLVLNYIDKGVYKYIRDNSLYK